MRPSRIPVVVSVLLGVLAFAWTYGRPSSVFVSAITFSLGVALVTLAFTELARALNAWLSREATLLWIAGGVIAGAGLFATGASFLTRGASLAFDWVAIVGIFVTLGGVRVQHRAR
jgi:hypothetical protein